MGLVMLMIWLRALFYNIGFTHFCVVYYNTDFNSTVKRYFHISTQFSIAFHYRLAKNGGFATIFAHSGSQLDSAISQSNCYYRIER